MIHIHHFNRLTASNRLFIYLCASTVFLSGCATKVESGAYVAATDARQRSDAETIQTGSNNVDTQATYLKLVDEMQKTDLWFASLAHIDALEQRWGVSPASNRMRADALRHASQPLESENVYKRLLGTPLEADALHGMGLLAGARSDYIEAARLLELARRQRPADSELLCDLGYALMRSGKLADARLPLMKAFQLRPDSRQAQVNLAVYFEASGEPARATALMEGNTMSEVTRAAIRDAARQLDAGLSPSNSAPGYARTTATSDASWPLALKTSQWTGVAALPSQNTIESTP